MQTKTYAQIAEEKSAENRKILLQGMKDFAKDMCAFVAINGFVAMIVLWCIVKTPW